MSRFFSERARQRRGKWTVYGAAALGIAGLLLLLLNPATPAGAQDVRVMQVWPIRSVGVSEGLVVDPEADTNGASDDVQSRVYPFGGYRRGEGDVVQARTYLHFPLNVFPPGARIKRAILHVYVDSSSSVGAASVGVYRAIEPWRTWDWREDAETWPALLRSPIAMSDVRVDVITPTSAISLPLPLLTPTPQPTLTPIPTPTGPSSPLATPTGEWTATPTLTSTPAPTRTPAHTVTLPTLSLNYVEGRWVTWDVTVLLIAWLAGEIDNDGVALAHGPALDVGFEREGLALARWLTANDVHTDPHLIVEFEVLPVTPTPTYPASPIDPPILPPAGRAGGWQTAGLLLVGAAMLLLGAAVLRK